MRTVVSKILCDLFDREKFVFLTGDLGFNALEPLRDIMKDFFINAGVAEQNMISVAAGLTKTGLKAWVYSIAPFCYARPFEQIRNDVCFQGLPVKLIGNGGGYAYGAMGATHHALEDYGTLLSLQGMRVFVPAFNEDVRPIVEKMANLLQPAYLRLGRCEKPKDFVLPKYEPWRCLIPGSDLIVLVVGPIAGAIIMEALKSNEIKPELWVTTELPVDIIPPPKRFLDRLKKIGCLCVIEEHVSHGGAGQQLTHWLASHNISLSKFGHLFAKGYPSGCYGSQAFHRAECGLDSQSIFNYIKMMVKGI
jgi:transketolase